MSSTVPRLSFAVSPPMNRPFARRIGTAAIITTRLCASSQYGSPRAAPLARTSLSQFAGSCTSPARDALVATARPDSFITISSS
jgi:hypothetical protein